MDHFNQIPKMGMWNQASQANPNRKEHQSLEILDQTLIKPKLTKNFESSLQWVTLAMSS